ncbi:MAG: hypothetical protein HC820_02360 [Hydrococcus sp. RM1_1_31]|nr:hypothetical protein [Hydrococcus sp. RM1_1_31]
MPPVHTYHRRESPTQTPTVAKLQEESMEIWGTPPRNIFQSNIPKVQAYEGSLPADARGIEFTTDIEPDSGTPPGIACWSNDPDNPREGVRVEERDGKTYLIIKVLSIVNRQT